jgi:hypothetical protein
MYNLHSVSFLKDIKKMFDIQEAILLSNSSRCQKELKECGLDTKLIYTPIFDIKKYQNLKDLPSDFTVAVYVADNPMHAVDGANGHSNIPLILDVAKSLPNIKFKFFGIDKMIYEDENIEFCGKIEETKIVDFINECSMYLRSTIHDGFPQLPIQFLLCGRHSLVSCPDEELKYVKRLSFEDNLDYEKNKKEIIDKIYEIKNSIIFNEKTSKHFFNKFNIDDIKNYYYELMSEDKFKENIYNLIK